MLMAKTLTSPNWVATLSSVKAPRIEIPPTASGRLAAARLPNTMTSSSRRIGNESVSARARSSSICELMSTNVGT